MMLKTHLKPPIDKTGLLKPVRGTSLNSKKSDAVSQPKILSNDTIEGLKKRSSVTSSRKLFFNKNDSFVKNTSKGDHKKQKKLTSGVLARQYRETKLKKSLN